MRSKTPHCITVLLFLSCTVFSVESFQRRIVTQENQYDYIIHPNTMFKDSFVILTVICSSKNPNTEVRVNWALLQVECMEELYKAQNVRDLSALFWKRSSPNSTLTRTDNPTSNSTGDISSANSEVLLDAVTQGTPMKLQSSTDQTYRCHEHNIIHPMDESDKPYYLALMPHKGDHAGIQAPKVMKNFTRGGLDLDKVEGRVTRTWETGLYHFLYDVTPVHRNMTFEAEVYVEMHSRSGYISAIDYPLMPFNLVMGVAYLIAVTTWLIVWARAHRHTAKIHIIIGVVAVAGAMSHVLQFINHASVNAGSEKVLVLLWFAHFLSAVEISLFNFLVIIVSVGYGITRPRLSKRILYAMLVLCCVQLCVLIAWRVCVDEDLKIQYNHPVITKLVLWTLSSSYILIAGWVMVAAIKTYRHLKVGRHTNQLLSFCVFSVFCVAAFIGQMVMFCISFDWMTSCRKHWQYAWLFSSFSSMQAAVLLVVLMVLWRPVDALQSYAFTALVDAMSDDNDGDDDGDSDVIYEGEGGGETEKFKLEPL